MVSAWGESDVGGEVVLDAFHKFMHGVSAEGELLHVDRILPDVPNRGVTAFLPNVNDVSRLDLALGLSFLLLWSSHGVELSDACVTAAVGHRRRRAAMRIMHYIYICGVDQMLMALSLP